MIAYLRGRFDELVANDEVSIDTTAGRMIARNYGPPGDLAPGDDVVVATATVPVGVVDLERTAFLGPWPADAPDPSDPLGLRSTPVVLLPDGSLAPVALAGIHRAGRDPETRSVGPPAPTLGLDLLAAVTSGVEVIVVSGADGRHIDLVRILGGRAIVASPLSGGDDAPAWLAAAELDAEIPIPIRHDLDRAPVPSPVLGPTHQLVQVDPTPALEEAGEPSDAAPDVLAAAAAGVLAGRIAAGNRRWRAALEP
jgi:hypothetical protein